MHKNLKITMKTILTYTHTRNLFIREDFKPFVHKYFKDVKFLGCESGNWEPKISISNWEEVKKTIPVYAIPEKIELDEKNITFLQALANGELGIARRIRGGDEMSYGQLKW